MSVHGTQSILDVVTRLHGRHLAGEAAGSLLADLLHRLLELAGASAGTVLELDEAGRRLRPLARAGAADPQARVEGGGQPFAEDAPVPAGPGEALASEAPVELAGDDAMDDWLALLGPDAAVDRLTLLPVLAGERPLGAIVMTNAGGAASAWLPLQRTAACLMVHERAERERDWVAEAVERLGEGASEAVGRDFFRHLVERVSAALDVSHALVGEIRGDRVRVLASAGGAGDGLDHVPAAGPTGVALEAGVAEFAGGLGQRFPEDRLVRELGAESYIGLGLRGSDGRPLGLLAVLDDRPMRNPGLVRSLLSAFAGRAQAELERLQVECSLGRSNETLASITSAALDAILMLDEQGRLAFWNPAAERIFGYTREAALGMPAEDLLAPACRSRGYLRAALAETPAPEAAEPGRLLELTARHRDGHAFPVELSVAPVRLEGERRVIGVLRDISRRRAAEDSLRRSEEQLRALINAMPEIVAFKDGEGRWLQVNQADLELFRLEGVDYRGKTDAELADYTHPVYREAFLNCEATDEQAWREGRHSRAEERIPTVDGGHRLLEVDKIPLFHEDGSRRGLVVLGRDITERRQWEQELRQSATVFENTSEGVMITDADGTIVAVNRAFAEITGYTAAEAIGRDPALLRSGRHDEAFYEAMWASIRETGRWQGEIWDRRKGGEVYPQWTNISTVRDTSGRVTHYVAVFSDISAIKESQAELDYLAHHDPLTDLPNRLLFNDRLEQAIKRARRDSEHVAVLFVDIDRFKNVNDGLGHPVGDELLESAARRLEGAVRRSDTIARLGGDEFLVLLDPVEDAEAVSRAARRLLDAFDEPFRIRDHSLELTASVGVSLYPDDGQSVAELVKNADAAMYAAKGQGRNRFEFYSRDLTAEVEAMLSLEAALRRALHRGELSLRFQPQLALADESLLGVEVLLRWQHPERGPVSPARFIPLAEETGLINDIGAWVLAESCRQLAEWQRRGVAIGRLAVNVSGVQVERASLQAEVRDALDIAGLPAHCLELEVTETALMRNAEHASAVLDGLRRLGVTLAVDDFGTGYSSMAYLKRFPLTKLKIDQSFVADIGRDPNDEAIANAIVALGRSLDLEVIAEGVERPEQARRLGDMGCQQVQGYLYARPMTAGELEAWLGLRD